MYGASREGMKMKVRLAFAGARPRGHHHRIKRQSPPTLSPPTNASIRKS
jgi:hypothetical protein